MYSEYSADFCGSLTQPSRYLLITVFLRQDKNNINKCMPIILQSAQYLHPIVLDDWPIIAVKIVCNERRRIILVEFIEFI